MSSSLFLFICALLCFLSPIFGQFTAKWSISNPDFDGNPNALYFCSSDNLEMRCSVGLTTIYFEVPVNSSAYLPRVAFRGSLAPCGIAVSYMWQWSPQTNQLWFTDSDQVWLGPPGGPTGCRCAQVSPGSWSCCSLTNQSNTVKIATL